jgi:hypothetical protein
MKMGKDVLSIHLVTRIRHGAVDIGDLPKEEEPAGGHRNGLV